MALSKQQIADLWIREGGNPDKAGTAAAIALAESGGDPNATNHNSNGTLDRGLFQVNSIHGALSTKNLKKNVRAAIRISGNGSNWSPWVTYNTGAYKKYATGGSSASGTGSGRTPRTPESSTRTIAGIDNSGARAAVQQQLGSNVRSFLGTPGSDALDFAMQQGQLLRQRASLVDTPDRTVQVPGAPGGGMPGSGSNPGGLDYVSRANALDAKHLPYKYGGGHGQKRVDPYSNTKPIDCSATVSSILGVDVRVSGAFEKFGKPGRSTDPKATNIYANGKHVFMEINGHFFGTSGSNPGGGAGWIKRSAISPEYLKGFTVRHTDA